MPRPKLQSDEAILDAAMGVLLRNGPAGFTLNDVAVALGMSRAALIQHFKNEDTLYLRLTERSGEQRRDDLGTFPVEVGPRGTWRFLTEIVAGMGTSEGLESYLLLAWEDLRDVPLRRMALERNLMVRDAIAARLPRDLASRAEVAAVLQDVIAGATRQWLVERKPSRTRAAGDARGRGTRTARGGLTRHRRGHHRPYARHALSGLPRPPPIQSTRAPCPIQRAS